MSKAILIMDMPKCCGNCSLHLLGQDNCNYCMATRRIIVDADRISYSCPLQSMPEKSHTIDKALELIYQYGQIDGAHHKAWVLDQVTRVLCGDIYEKFVHDYQYLDDDGNESEELIYEWDEGIAP